MKKHGLLYVFFIFIFSITILDFVSKDKEFSDLENRRLSSKPKFTIKSFFKNEFSTKYEKYINDQFVFRDNWIDIKSISESILGKVENNKIIYGKDGYMFEKVDELDLERVNNNLNAINILSQNTNIPITVMIAPNSSEIYKDKQPIASPILNQELYIKDIYNNIKNASTINLIDLLSKAKDKYIYYKTDHHWTSYGAYLAYKEFVDSIGMNPIELNSLKENNASGFYGTYFSKAKLFNAKDDTLTYYNFDNLDMTIGEDKYNSIYDYSKLEEVDKYGVFLRGNNPLTIIKNNNLNNGKKLLVFKDSYANTLTPFLTQNYEEVHLIDLRHYGAKVSSYLEENNFDNILILYNFNTFISDVNIIKLKY